MTVVGNHVTKDAKPSEKSSELRTVNDNKLVVTGDAESFATLADLPKMSLKFLEKMDKLTFNYDGAIEVAVIEGFRWRSTASMTITLAPSGIDAERRIVEARGREFRDPSARA